MERYFSASAVQIMIGHIKAIRLLNFTFCEWGLRGGGEGHRNRCPFQVIHKCANYVSDMKVEAL